MNECGSSFVKPKFTLASTVVGDFQSDFIVDKSQNKETTKYPDFTRFSLIIGHMISTINSSSKNGDGTTEMFLRF